MNKERDYLLDTVKAVSICLVFVWHVQPFKFILLENSGSYSLLTAAVDLFNVEVTLIGVPPSSSLHQRRILYALSVLLPGWETRRLS